MKKYLTYSFFSVITAIFFYNCAGKQSELLEMQEYTGPIVEGTNLIIYRSDSAVVTLKMETPRYYSYGNGDEEYPDGFFLEFYDKEGNPTSFLRADYCFYTKKEDLYKATGNVVVQDAETNDRLDTEELFWNQKKEEVFTEKFVRIEKDGELHVGDGLEAKQDFSYWKILNSKGTITLDEQN